MAHLDGSQSSGDGPERKSCGKLCCRYEEAVERMEQKGGREEEADMLYR